MCTQSRCYTLESQGRDGRSVSFSHLLFIGGAVIHFKYTTIVPLG
jgi:hypothetical protein